MIDFHTHVLPNIDDGAADVQMATKMIEQELSQGVEEIVFTPHYYGRKRRPEQFLEERQQVFEELKPHIPENVKIYLGSEVHFTGINILDDEELCKLAIEGTRYILVEFPFVEKWSTSLLERLSDFIYDTGYTPIIAHVERYQEVLKNPAIITHLVEMGCLIQVNTRAFINKWEKNFAFALLKHGLVHCIGTDAHDVTDRAPDYEEAKIAVEKAGYGKAWAEIQHNMRAILNGGTFRIPIGGKVKKFMNRYY
ncbi:MAG: hypothetical protein IJX87_02585 [Clostridia bacterium]|nr:hypothetical protein [Clostridia bacterium]